MNSTPAPFSLQFWPPTTAQIAKTVPAIYEELVLFKSFPGRASAIESGLFKIQAKHLLQFRQRRQVHRKCEGIIDRVYHNALATEEAMQQDDDQSALLIPAHHRP
jgi:hypothetical protein